METKYKILISVITVFLLAILVTALSTSNFGNLNVLGNLSVSGPTNITGSFNVTGPSTFIGNVLINGTLNITKNITSNGGQMSYNGTNWLFT